MQTPSPHRPALHSTNFCHVLPVGSFCWCYDSMIIDVRPAAWHLGYIIAPCGISSRVILTFTLTSSNGTLVWQRNRQDDSARIFSFSALVPCCFAKPAPLLKPADVASIENIPLLCIDEGIILPAFIIDYIRCVNAGCTPAEDTEDAASALKKLKYTPSPEKVVPPAPIKKRLSVKRKRSARKLDFAHEASPFKSNSQ